MKYKFVNKVNIKYNPSVVEYCERYEVFVCGTYQLIEDIATHPDISDQRLKEVNQRLGNLVIIDNQLDVIEEYECFDGGVFDLKVADNLLIGVHSNGFVVSYQMIKQDNKLQIQTLRRYSTDSSLLTTLTPIIFKSMIIVGNSDGQLIALDLSSEAVVNLSVTKFSEPIWSLFCHKLDDNYLLCVGSDDSLFRIYWISEQDLSEELFPNLRPLRVISDFSAGVTSFGSNHSSSEVLSLMVGSYDESIRFYDINFTEDNQITNVCLRDKLHIPESGIWRIITGHSSKEPILVSGMYSGAHLIADNQVIQTLDPLDSDPNEKHLIYGLNCDSDMNYIIMSSFYEKIVYRLTKC